MVPEMGPHIEREVGRDALTPSSFTLHSPDCPQLAETRQKPAKLGVGTTTERGVENNSTYPCLGVYMKNISFLKDLS